MLQSECARIWLGSNRTLHLDKYTCFNGSFSFLYIFGIGSYKLLLNWITTFYVLCTGIGTGQGTLEQCVELASRAQVAQQWRKCHHLIIDEISMVDGDFFDKLETVARYDQELLQQSAWSSPFKISLVIVMRENEVQYDIFERIN